MAHAVKKPKDDYVVELTLSKDEAQTLINICGYTTGTQKTRRRDTDAMYTALRNIGISVNDTVDEIKFVNEIY